MRMKGNINNPIFCLVIGIAIGFILSIMPYICCMKFILEIPIFDIISLLVTIVLAIYVAQVLERDTQKSQVCKQMYISKIEQNECILSSINDYIGQDIIYLAKINNIILRYRIIQKTIHTALKENEKKVNFSSDCSAIENAVKELNILLTMTPVDNTEQSNITILDGKIHYSENRKSEITTSLSKIDRLFFMLKNKINNTL